MLHLHALLPSLALGLASSDALLLSTLNPGRMARVTFFEGDYREIAQAIERGELANAGQPLACEEVEQWVARALGETPPTPMAQSA